MGRIFFAGKVVHSIAENTDAISEERIIEFNWVKVQMTALMATDADKILLTTLSLLTSADAIQGIIEDDAHVQATL